MRILMTGSRNKHLLAPAYGRYFASMSEVQVDYINHPDEFEDLHAVLLNKIRYRLAPRTLLSKINSDIVRRIEEFKPDVLWIFKGMEVFPETLQYAKSKNIFLACYNPDHPFRFVSRGSGNQFVSNCLSLYDLHFTYSLKIREELQRDYGIEAIHLPFGYDIPYELGEFLPSDEVCRVAFIGFKDEIRTRFVQELVRSGIPVDVYGPGWDRAGGPAMLSTHPAVYDEEYWRTLRKYRVQINIFRDHNEDSHNMRSFEIPASSGIMLAPETREHTLFFKEGDEYFSYKDRAEMIQKSQLLLSLSFQQAAKIRENARIRCNNSGYSYSRRAEFVVSEFSRRLNLVAGRTYASRT